MVTRKASVKPAAKRMPKSASVSSPVASRVKCKRDRFIMPANEYLILKEIKKLFLASGEKVKKSELLRVGLGLIGELSFTDLKRAVSHLAPIDRSKKK